MQPPVLLADILAANTLLTLDKGEVAIPEKMLNRLLSGLPLPMPLVSVELACQSGFFELSVQLDLREQGLPLRPKVKQKFDLERLRLDPTNQFVLIKPRGGLQVDEGSTGRRKLSPMAKALLTTILHTPTLLKLVRDRFPKNINYEHGRLHVDLSTLGPIQSLVAKETPIGHVQLTPMQYLNIHDVDIRKGAVVLRYRFEKEGLLEALRSAPPEGFYAPGDLSGSERRTRRLLPPPEERVPETPAERAVRLGAAGVERGKMLFDRVMRSRR